MPTIFPARARENRRFARASPGDGAFRPHGSVRDGRQRNDGTA